MKRRKFPGPMDWMRRRFRFTAPTQSNPPAILFIARATWRDFVAEEFRWVLFASQEAHLSTAAHIKSLLRPSNSADAISDLSYFLTDSDDSGLASLKV